MFECRDATIDTHDSPLGRWTAGRWVPPPGSQLCGFVERIWYFDGVMTNSRERVFPDGSAELIVMLDEPHRDGDIPALSAFPAICVNGLRTRAAVVVSPPGRCRVLGVRFSPLGAGALLRSSMVDLVDVTIDVRDALGRAADELGERCFDAAQSSVWNAAANAISVLRAAAKWTQHLIEPDAGADALIASAIRTIRELHGAVSIGEMGGVLGISRTRFAQRFRARTGVSPKTFARIVRFNAALSRLSRSEGIALVADDLGYFDQAHMYRDFEEFAGMTPGEFLTANRYPNSPSLAES